MILGQIYFLVHHHLEMLAREDQIKAMAIDAEHRRASWVMQQKMHAMREQANANKKERKFRRSTKL